MTFSKAPIVSPNRLATLSVAWLNNPANGIIATAFIAKMISALRWAKLAAIPMGTKIKSTLMGLYKRASLVCRPKRKRRPLIPEGEPGSFCPKEEDGVPSV